MIRDENTLAARRGSHTQKKKGRESIYAWAPGLSGRLASVHSKVNVEYYGKQVPSLASSTKSDSRVLRESRAPSFFRGTAIPLRRPSSLLKTSDTSQRMRVEKKLAQSSTQFFEQSTKQSKYIESIKYDDEYWVLRKRIFNDQDDWSSHPSFTIKNVAYNLECELLYSEARDKYDAQFKREMEYFIASKPNVCDQYFTRRLLSYTTYWPPLHTKPELQVFIRKFFQLTPPQKKHLHLLMNTDLSYI